MYMNKEKNIIDYATITITRNGRKSHLEVLSEKLASAGEVTLFHTLAMGWNFYHHCRPPIPKGKNVHPIYISFAGFRIYLDERIPPNMCVMRDNEGNAIKKFFWSA